MVGQCKITDVTRDEGLNHHECNTNNTVQHCAVHYKNVSALRRAGALWSDALSCALPLPVELLSERADWSLSGTVRAARGRSFGGLLPAKERSHDTPKSGAILALVSPVRDGHRSYSSPSGPLPEMLWRSRQQVSRYAECSIRILRCLRRTRKGERITFGSRLARMSYRKDTFFS